MVGIKKKAFTFSAIFIVDLLERKKKTEKKPKLTPQGKLTIKTVIINKNT